MARGFLSNYKAVIFDWDGTLVDTCGLVLDAHNHVRKHMGHKLWTMDDFLGQASKSAREYYPEVYGDKAEEGMKVLYEFVDEHHLTYLKAMPQALEMLALIKEQNIPMGIVSNKRHETLLVEVVKMGWDEYFKAIIGAGYAQRDKPAPDSLLIAMSQIEQNLQPSDILYVGDTETDLLCAQNTGCPVVLIQSDKPRPDLIDKYNPKEAFENLSAFMKAVTN